ncbi:MAG TPA: hypothetical protein VFA68_10930 [Terriglobales bacterium]|nr:hypothetical protein [Terriglobales bacterium]
MARSSASTRGLTDSEEIRQWAEERGAKPACVRKTGRGGDVGIIRLDFPGYSGGDTLEPISWEDWFRKFEDSNLALIVQDETASGERSNFNKLVSRDTPEGHSRPSRSRRKATGNSRQSVRNAASRNNRGAAGAARGQRSSARSAGKRTSGTRGSSRSRASRGTSGKKTSARATGAKRGGSSRGNRGSGRKAA